jgi:hypothetical protein
MTKYTIRVTHTGRHRWSLVIATPDGKGGHTIQRPALLTGFDRRKDAEDFKKWLRDDLGAIDALETSS